MRSLLSLQKAGLMGCLAPSFMGPGPSHHLSGMRLLSMTSPSPNLVTSSSLMGSLPTKPIGGAWPNIKVGSRLTLISLVIGPLPSNQKTELIGCAAPPFINLGPSHYLSDVTPFIQDTR